MEGYVVRIRGLSKEELKEAPKKALSASGGTSLRIYTWWNNPVFEGQVVNQEDYRYAWQEPQATIIRGLFQVEGV